MEDINKVACAMHEIFNPDKVNYGAYGDTEHHLHFHLVGTTSRKRTHKIDKF